MNKIFTVFIMFIIAIISSCEINAQNPTFDLSAANFQFTDSIGTGGVADDAMTFDILIWHTNAGTSGPFEFALGQYYFNVSSVIGVTADFNYYIVPGSTQFSNSNAVPRNPTFVSPDGTSPIGASLRVNSNTVLGAGSGPIVSTIYPGTRVCTMRFKKKVGSTADFPLLNMTWRTALPNPFSKVFAYVGTTNTDITLNGNYDIGPGSATLLYPQNNSINNPLTVNFIWNKRSSSTGYLLQIYTDSLITNNIVSDTLSNSDSARTVTGFNKNIKFFWRVGTKDINENYYFSPLNKFTTTPGLRVNLKIIPEGLYYPIFNLLSRRDTFSVYARNTVIPFAVIDSAKSVVDSISFKGNFVFKNAPEGTYFLQVKHFSSVETWSKSIGIPMTLTDTAFYDFTSEITQAYGSNLKFKSDKYCIYSGDINQDGIIDASDLIKVYNDSYVGLTGRYLVSDLNGDNVVDASDISTADNNVFAGILKIIP